MPWHRKYSKFLQLTAKTLQSNTPGWKSLPMGWTAFSQRMRQWRYCDKAMEKIMAVLMKLGIMQFIQTASAETWGLMSGICWATHQDAGQPACSTATRKVKRVESAEGSTAGVFISENGRGRKISSLHIIKRHSSHCLSGISFRLHWCSWVGHVQRVALRHWLESRKQYNTVGYK